MGGAPTDVLRSTGGARPADERATLLEYLRTNRLILRMKCEGLTPEQLAARSVEPSTVSLLGPTRRLAAVEQSGMVRVMAGHLEIPQPFSSTTDRDEDFTGTVADPAMVADALWEESCTFTDAWVAAHDLSETGDMGGGYGPVSLREVPVQLIEEYARHNGHADPLRGRIDGRTGQ